MLDYEFKYFRYGSPGSIQDENLDYLLDAMVDHFRYGKSCCQRVLDHNEKIGYVISEGDLEDLEEDLDYEERVLIF
jgi:hypothetical protein